MTRAQFLRILREISIMLVKGRRPEVIQSFIRGVIEGLE